jgi:hypothetical protein
LTPSLIVAILVKKFLTAHRVCLPFEDEPVKDFDQAALETGRPSGTPLDLINFCLKALYNDRDHATHENIVRGLSFEELIGALLVARDSIQNQQQQIEENDRRVQLLLDHMDLDTMNSIAPQWQAITKDYLPS